MHGYLKPFSQQFLLLMLIKTKKELNSNRHLMNEKELKVLDRSLRSCVLNGQNLNAADSELCKQLNTRIQEKQIVFNERLQFANRHFGIRISDKSIVENLPTHILKMMCHDRFIIIIIIAFE